MEQLSLLAATQASGTVVLPGSKSISNRTLLLAALSAGTTLVRGLLESDDTLYMRKALGLLGVVIEKQGDTQDYLVHGVSGQFPVQNADLFLGNAGTAFRPLTSALALMQGNYRLSGVARMHERPIKDLVDALHSMGAKIDYLGEHGFPPLAITPAKIDVQQAIQVKGNVSSQFLTSLLLSAPLIGQRVVIEVIGDLISKPYIDITIKLMDKFGVKVLQDQNNRYIIEANQSYVSPVEIYVEGDASSASYFLAAGALAKGPIQVQGVGEDSIQGDIRFAEALKSMGARIDFDKNSISASSIPQGLQAINGDFNHIPDAAMTLAVLALAANGTSTLKNIASWRVKETDRLQAMATELRKFGAEVVEGPDFIQITPPKSLPPNVQVNTYDDHRMAMCFSLVSLMGVPVTINDPKCVNKTFPNYFDALASLKAI